MDRFASSLQSQQAYMDIGIDAFVDPWCIRDYEARLYVCNCSKLGHSIKKISASNLVEEQEQSKAQKSIKIRKIKEPLEIKRQLSIGTVDRSVIRLIVKGRKNTDVKERQQIGLSQSNSQFHVCF